MRGGYIILDMSSASFTSSEPKTIPGVYSTLEGNYGKAVMLSNFTLDGVEYPATYVEFTYSSNYTGVAYGNTITITAEDAVTFGGVE